MATNFPTSLDSLTNPQGTDSVAAVSHATQHANANDAIEALEAKVGANNSAVTTSLDYRVRTLESASVDTEAIQDIVGGMVSSNTETDWLSSDNYSSSPSPRYGRYGEKRPSKE